MSEPNGRYLWLKILGPLIPLATAALIGFGALKSDVRTVREDVATKASRETVDAKFDAIIQRLDRIERKLDQGTR